MRRDGKKGQERLSGTVIFRFFFAVDECRKTGATTPRPSRAPRLKSESFNRKERKRAQRRDLAVQAVLDG
jgi:hypothetical protein